MLIKKKRIRKLEIYLPPVEAGRKVVFGVSSVERFLPIFNRIGFTDRLEGGETVLPSVIGPISRFNAEGKHLIHRDRPKETKYRMIQWTRTEWRGKGETEDVTDLRDLPYKRYPRTEIPAPSVELKVVLNSRGERFVVSPSEVYTPENRLRLLHIINLFLEIFGECEVFHENLDLIVNMSIKRLNWKI